MNMPVIRACSFDMSSNAALSGSTAASSPPTPGAKSSFLVRSPICIISSVEISKKPRTISRTRESSSGSNMAQRTWSMMKKVCLLPTAIRAILHLFCRFQTRRNICHSVEASPDHRVPAVVLCQGLSGVRDPVLPEVARCFAAAGFASLAFDYHGYGQSDGEMGGPRPTPDPLSSYSSEGRSMTSRQCLPLGEACLIASSRSAFCSPSSQSVSFLPRLRLVQYASSFTCASHLWLNVMPRWQIGPLQGPWPFRSHSGEFISIS